MFKYCIFSKKDAFKTFPVKRDRKKPNGATITAMVKLINRYRKYRVKIRKFSAQNKPKNVTVSYTKQYS